MYVHIYMRIMLNDSGQQLEFEKQKYLSVKYGSTPILCITRIDKMAKELESLCTMYIDEPRA